MHSITNYGISSLSRPASASLDRASSPTFGQTVPEQPPEETEPGLLSLLLQYGKARIARSRQELQAKREWADARHQRELQARGLAFDAFPPIGFENRVKPTSFQRKRDIIRELAPLIDAGFASEAIDDILTPIVTHNHPMIRHEFVFNLLGKLENNEAKACVLSHCLKHLRKDSSLENRQKIMDVIEALPPEPIPSEYHYLLFTPAHSHMRYWAAKLFSHDENPELKRRAEAVMATSIASPKYQ